MKSLVPAVCVLGFAISFGGIRAAIASNPENSSPLTSPGELQKLSDALAPIFQFYVDNSNLKINSAAWENAAKDNAKNAAAAIPMPGNQMQGVPPNAQAMIRNQMAMMQNMTAAESGIETLFQRVEQRFGQSSRGRSGVGRNMRREFSGEKMAGRLQIKDETIRVTFEETQSPQRLVQFTTDGDAAFRIQLIHPDGDLILLSQNSNGRFSATAILEGNVFSGQGESFLEFFRKYRKEMQNSILPALAEFGISPILSPDVPEVRNAVLALVLRSQESRAEGEKLLADLDNDTYDTREKASRLLSRRYELYRDLINEKLKDSSASAEVQARLKHIVDEHQESQRVNSAITALKLLDDPNYLVSLLDDTDSKESPILIQRLEKITDQHLGSDSKAWKDWAEKNQN